MSAVSFPKSLGRSSQETFAVITLRWLREQRQAIVDLIIMLSLSVFTFFIFLDANITEAFFEYTRRHEAANVDDKTVALLFVIAIFLPIFALRRWNESTRRLHQANTDSLTGLFNRRKGGETLELEIARAHRHQRPLSIILFDLDCFKAVNDKHGHLAGDRVLKTVARTIRGKMRSFDTLVRWGGEEFLVIAVETDGAGARQVAERLRQTVEERFRRDSIHVTASFGVAQLEENDDLNALYRRVDEKLYEAKSAGRNKVA